MAANEMEVSFGQQSDQSGPNVSTDPGKQSDVSDEQHEKA
jgi:hypothetical protein